MIFNVQLAMDCSDPDEIMRFWGRTLNYDNANIAMSPDELREWRKDYPQYDGRGRVDDNELRRMPIYIQQVPEPKTVRNRWRPEISVAPGRIGALASGVDVEGNEFSVVESEEDPVMRTIEVECSGPYRMLEFWSQALMYEPSGDRCDPLPGWQRIEDGWFVAHGERIAPADTLRRLAPTADLSDRALFDLTPGFRFVKGEPERVKNRFHIDLHTCESEWNRDRLVALGAEVVQWDTDHVLRDPEGNLFCAG